MEKRNWFEAEKISKKAKNRSIYDFVQWNHLITTGNRATFFDYKNFIERNKNYPRIGRIKYLLLRLEKLRAIFLKKKV